MFHATRRTRSILALAVASVLVMGACGSDDSSADPSTTAATTTVATDATTPATDAADTTPETPATEVPTTDAPTTTVAETTTTVSTEPHTIVHAMGSTEVVADPQRVVVLDSSFLDAAVALGVVPVGATEGVPGRALPVYLGADVTAQITIVGDTTTPNLELVASMQPDLIIGSKVRHEAIYDALSQIAPTVFSETSGSNWRDQFNLTADALGRTDAAATLLAGFDARAAQVGADIGAAGQTATIIRFIPDQTRLYGPGTFSGSVLTQVGFDLGDKGFDPNFSIALVSQEQTELIDSDVIFATTFADAGSARPAFEGLWANLPAVQAGHQFDIADDTWMTGIGVLGANHILDDLEAWLGA